MGKARPVKISDVKTYPVWIGHRNQCLVKVETDSGLFGWGESGLSGRELAVAGALQHYREILLGRNPLEIGGLWQELYRSQYFEGGRVLAAAISALDIALHDIAGKALGVPVYQLLGGKQRDRVPCFATAGAAVGPELVDDVQRLADLGWTVIRTMTAGPRDEQGRLIFEPRRSLAETARRLIEVREACGSDLVLGVDFHHRLTVAEAASFCQRMPAGTLDFLEEPIRDETPEAYEALRTMTNVPFAIGEEFASKWQFLPYIERGITNFARIDVCNVGGLTESMKVAAMAEAHYIDLMPHNPLGPICTAATIHFGAAVPNFSWLEYRTDLPAEAFTNRDVFTNVPAIDGTAFPVSDAPGLGIEVNEDALAGRTFEFWEAPRFYREDGSITNW